MENKPKKYEIVGPESTGKSVLTVALAAVFQTTYSLEFSRFFLNYLNRKYIKEDLETMATGQLLWNKEAFSNAENCVFFDTGVLTIKLWQEIKYSVENPFLSSLFLDNLPDYYILCYPDLPWEADPLRETADLETRVSIFEAHKKLIETVGVPYFVVNGENRIEQTVKFIENTNLFN